MTAGVASQSSRGFLADNRASVVGHFWGGYRTIEVLLSSSSAADDRDRLLTDGVVAMVEALVAMSTGRDDEPIIVDVRVPDADASRLVGCEAFVEAVRGLMQSFVLESRDSIGPLNLMVSHPDQETERELSVTYFAAPTGSFSRGATYDLRRGPM